MFDIGFPELILIAIVGLLVIGPERLPEALRTLGLWFGRMRRSFTAVKSEIEKEIGMDEVRRQLHNEAIMDEMKRIEQEVQSTTRIAQDTLNEGAKAAQAPAVSAVPDAAAADHSDASDTSDTSAKPETPAAAAVDDAAPAEPSNAHPEPQPGPDADDRQDRATHG